MATLHSKKEHAQFKGPLTSDRYNKRIEALYKDLTSAFNKIGLTEEDVVRGYQRMLKQQWSTTKMIRDLEARLINLELEIVALTFGTSNNDDTSRFDATAYEVESGSKCFQDTDHGLVLLPKVEEGSVSKLTVTSASGKTFAPTGLETRVSPVITSADNLSAIIDTSPVEASVINKSGSIWERNVVVDSSDADGAILDLYVKIPEEITATENCNAILIHPFPVFACDILDVSISTKFDIVLNDNDDYVTLNSDAIHSGDATAVGWIAPGGWSNDVILNSGIKMFYFDPQAVTALRITLRQKNYFVDGDKFLYTYGLSSLDARDDKFTNSGKIIFRFDAPEGETISTVSSVAPQIWNVAEAEIPDIFSHRVIWETSFDSDVYTLSPVALSDRVWIEVTLNKTAGGGTPSLSGLVIDYD